jgi:hypothetical protein
MPRHRLVNRLVVEEKGRQLDITVLDRDAHCQSNTTPVCVSSFLVLSVVDEQEWSAMIRGRRPA